MKFIRFGGLSASFYPKDKKFAFEYHKPPVEKGIFAFIHPYADAFLWAWKFPLKDGETEKQLQERWNKYLPSINTSK